jgi:hypothetical protein
LENRRVLSPKAFARDGGGNDLPLAAPVPAGRGRPFEHKPPEPSVILFKYRIRFLVAPKSAPAAASFCLPYEQSRFHARIGNDDSQPI